MKTYFIIADDITGANDTGVQLTRRGIPTIIAINPEDIAANENSYVFDTESRNIDPKAAYEKIKASLKIINIKHFDCIIKKVDSTLRGNIAEEIKAVDEAFKSELIVFMPALPDLGRTTKNGIHMLNGVPITQTELAKDPQKPVVTDNLLQLLATTFDEDIYHISLEDIQSDSINLSSSRIVTADAVTNKHMQAVVKAALETGKRVLWVGTAAIADNLLETEVPQLPSLGIVASVSEVTREQVHFAENSGATLVIIPPDKLLNGEDFSPYVESAVQLLQAKKDVIILSSASYDRDELEKTIRRGAELGISKTQTGVLVQNLLGSIANKVLEQSKVSGIFLTGGDTAMGFFESVGATSFKIIAETAVGIPLMCINSGKLKGCKAITKAGAFGEKNAIFYSLRKLKEC